MLTLLIPSEKYEKELGEIQLNLIFILPDPGNL